MAILSKGTTYADGDQITSTNLNALVDSATFAAGAVESGGGLQLNGSSPAQLKVAGNVDIGTSNLTATGAISLGATTFNDNNITHVGSIALDTIIADDSSGNTDVTIDAPGDITLDAGGADIRLKDDGTQFGRLANSSSDLVVASSVSDKDILLQGSDGGSTITALTLDMSAAGAATFNDKITAVGTSVFTNLDISGDVDVDGTTNLDVVDIDGAVDMATTALVTGVLTTTATQVATGGITSGSSILSDTDSTDSLGSTAVRWLKGWFDTLTAGTLTIGAGSVTDSSGAISFGNENLTTTGTVTAAGTSVFTNLDISGDVDVDGTLNVDAIDIDGNVQVDGTVTVGVNDTGHDVKFYGATSGAYMHWDESTDDLILGGVANLGIGTTAPMGIFHAHNGGTQPTAFSGLAGVFSKTTGGATQVSLYSTNATVCDLLFSDPEDVDVGRVRYDHSSNSMSLTTNASTQMTIDSAGNVGINDSSPSYKLDVNGTGRFTSHVQFDGQVTVGANADSDDVKFFGSTSGAYLHWDVSGDHLNLGGGASLAVTGDAAFDTDTLFVDASTDRVGINDSTPSYSLDVNGTGRFTSTVQFDGQTQNYNGAYDIYRSGGGYLRHRIADQTLHLGVTNTAGTVHYPIVMAAASDVLHFNNEEGEMARFDTSGNFGIGTTSPGVPLQISKAGECSLDLEDTGGQKYRLFTRNSDDVFGIYDVTNSDTWFRYTGNATIGSTKLALLEGGGNVGIGTTAPTVPLQIDSTAGAGVLIRNDESSNTSPILEVRGQRSDTNNSSVCGGGVGLTRWSPSSQIVDGNSVGSLYFGGSHGATTALEANVLYTASIQAEADQTWSAAGSMATDLVFRTGVTGRAYAYNQSYGDSEVMRITHEARVGIGTTSPDEKLDVVGAGRFSTGVTFGTDTAAANKLDDYEEGSWTPTISFGGASVSVEYDLQVGRYTKIGDLVTASCYMDLADSGTSTGNAVLAGLPFASKTLTGGSTPATLRLENISFADIPMGYNGSNTSTIIFQESTNAGTVSTLTNGNFSDTSIVTLSISYRV